jgi:hypothetical protein
VTGHAGSPGDRDYVTIRDIISRLEELARDLDDGVDTRFELGICDGGGAQIVDNVDLDQYQVMSEGRQFTGQFVMLRGHVHPGEKPGEYLPGIASEADRELRELTEGDGG